MSVVLPAPRGLLFVVSAPSGAGKTSLVEALIDQGVGLRRTVSHTTRQPRPGERDGVDYHFVDDERFEQMLENGAFVEHAGVFGRRYGTSAQEVERCRGEGHDAVAVIDWQGARCLREVFAEAVTVFVLPPSLEELARRLRGRASDSEEQVARRLAEAEGELAHRGEFGFQLVNDDFDQALADLRAVVHASRLRSPV